ncbi:hypothetical protein AKJ09_01633 [Labilithrix luteola]|uniref:Uncharacterized protein n=1 Tax=Labilithrix luteola TaxID=1391654 RepID=A0A0K1PPB9_9BACT|nr:hypothetical protein [Labilithrix luteola]AKU94969.1 hypothetical protein AKJ09_01633 [Labilithrix luteola]
MHSNPFAALAGGATALLENKALDGTSVLARHPEAIHWLSARQSRRHRDARCRLGASP